LSDGVVTFLTFLIFEDDSNRVGRRQIIRAMVKNTVMVIENKVAEAEGVGTGGVFRREVFTTSHGEKESEGRQAMKVRQGRTLVGVPCHHLAD
jgi:hypothetical protein